jgi:hypothetical protein
MNAQNESESAVRKIEDIIRENFDGVAKRNALDFADFLKANEMVYTGVHCEVHYKEPCVCFVYLDGDEKTHEHSPWHSPWTVWTAGEYPCERDDVPIDGRAKETAWANICHCANCGNTCSPGHVKTVFGKEFKNVCNAVMMFRNPDAETVGHIKKFVEMRKREIDSELLCRKKSNFQKGS